MIIKPKKVMTIFLLVVGIIGISIFFVHKSQMKRLFEKTSSSLFDIENQSLEDILKNSSEFKLEKKILSLKKHYFITVDDVIVGEVTGKFFTVFGDKLEMADSKGNIVKTEYQVKRMGPTNGKLFNLSFDRLAEIQDDKGVVSGYIGEEKLKDFWKINHRQYFYNADGDKQGSAKPDFFILSKDYKISDNEDNVDYIIDGNIVSASAKATITKTDNSNIDEASIIFYTIIENSIIDSKMSGSSSSSSGSSSSKK